ncbi:MAG: alkaline phosphatase family protein [Microthrixaceae bacterium]
MGNSRDGDPRITRLLDALTSPACADMVEMVLHSPAEHNYHATAPDGSVSFERVSSGRGWDYRVTAVQGRDPLAERDTGAFVGLANEIADVFPDRTANSYPHAYDSIAQFFDSPHAPDLLATHTSRHFVEGYLGQHGSLGAVQARAPFIASGAGIRALGTVDRSTRVVNIAPTLAALMGVEAHPDGVGSNGLPDEGALLLRQDGVVEVDILDGRVARHVVVVLLDGCNANLLAAVIEAGEAPHMATMVADGMMFGRGSMASLPTATLANHTTALTGAHPGHSGVLHNAWVERSTNGKGHSEVDLLDLQQMWWASARVGTDVETLFEAVSRTRPGAFTSAGFEFCDRGASFSTFALVRDGDASSLPEPDDVRHIDADAAADEQYGFMSRVDHLSLIHTLDCWNGAHGNELPTLSWCSLALTDTAGHASGPHGNPARAAVRDSDARIGELMAAVERAGVREDTAFVVIADHGMEQADPTVDATWDAALAATGIPHSDVGGGLIYLE